MTDNNRKYKSVGQRLRMALKRSAIPCPGKVATLLLDSFVYCGGKITAGQVESLGLCANKEFSKWRKNLIDKEWLEAWQPGDYSKHRCGKKLLKYVNDAKLLVNELATKTELEELASKDDLETLASKVSEMEKSLSRIIDIIDPPDSKLKRERLKNGGYDNDLRLISNDSSLTGQNHDLSQEPLN